MNGMASQITDNSNCCSTSCSSQHQKQHQNFALLALGEGNPPVMVIGGSPSQRDNDAEMFYMSWRYRIKVPWYSMRSHQYYTDTTMSVLASHITGNSPICSTVFFFRRTSKKTSKFRDTGLCEGNPPVTGTDRPEGPDTRKMFPFDGVIMDLMHTGKYRRIINMQRNFQNLNRTLEIALWLPRPLYYRGLTGSRTCTSNNIYSLYVI